MKYNTSKILKENVDGIIDINFFSHPIARWKELNISESYTLK